MKTIIAILCLAVSGCSTIRNMTPEQKAVVLVIVAGSIAISTNKGDSPQRKTTIPVNCSNPAVCQ